MADPYWISYLRIDFLFTFVIRYGMLSALLECAFLLLLFMWLKDPYEKATDTGTSMNRTDYTVQEEETTMEEKILAKGTSSKLNVLTVFFGLATVVLFVFVFYFIQSHDSQAGIWFVMALAMAGVTALVYWAMSCCQIVVTDKRIYGKVAFGKQVDLPLDSVSAVAVTSVFTQGVSVATSSGRITFFYLANRNDVSQAIRELLVKRQNKAQMPTVVKQEVTQSSADELKKFKELLDTGVITQEEFDTKKKQLLGL